EIQVAVDGRKLAGLGRSIDTVIQRLQRENSSISGGRLEEGTQRYLVRTVHQFASEEEIRDRLLSTRTVQAGDNGAADEVARVAAASGNAAVLAAAMGARSSGGSQPAGGVAVRLGDVATVRQGYKEREAIIRLDSREAVELALYKEGDANTVATAAAVEERLQRIRKELPEGVRLDVVDDQARFIRAAISDVRTDAVLGGTLAILIIFLFLRSGWSTFVIGVSLPVSIITTFFFMDQMGLSLNVMSLGGLALARGLV